MFEWCSVGNSEREAAACLSGVLWAIVKGRRQRV